MHAYVAHNATLCMHVAQIIPLHACLCGRYTLLSRVSDDVHTCVTETASAFMRAWQIQPVWRNMRLLAYLCDDLGQNIDAAVAHTACVAGYATTCIPVMHMYLSLCGGCSNCMHAYVAGYATACMPVWRIQLVWLNVADSATACIADYAAACVPVWQIMRCVHA